MKLLLAITLLIITAPAVSARQDAPGAPDKPVCSLNTAQAPVISGLRLGMTAEQVLALFPGSGEDPEVRSGVSNVKKLGVSNFVIRPDKYRSKERFAGISQISFNLLDGRVYIINVNYAGPEWPHVDKFVAKVIEETGLPAADAWEAYSGLDTQLKMLTCSGFEIRVFAGGAGGSLNYIRVSDLVAAQTLKERREKARQESKQ